MRVEDRIRSAIDRATSGSGPAPDAWARIEGGLRGARRRDVLNRALVAIAVLALASGGIVLGWFAFQGSDRSVHPAVAPTPTHESAASPMAPTGDSPRDCPKKADSTASADFDGDGTTDSVWLHLLPGYRCDGADPFRDAFLLRADLGDGDHWTARFPDCASFQCEIEGTSDFDGDGRSELVVRVGPGAAITFWRVYRVGHLSEGIQPLRVAEPGDHPFVDPGQAVFGGNQDAINEDGFACVVTDAGQRLLRAWGASRDRGTGPWFVHYTDLELRGDTLFVTGTEDRPRVPDEELSRQPLLCP